MTDFIVVGNKNAMQWKTVWPLWFDKKIFFGYNYINRFDCSNGDTVWLQGLPRWFTSIKPNKEVPPLPLVEYDPEKHRTYDTYPAVNTDSIYQIPDVDSEIGVPIGIFDYLNEEQFEITGLLCRGSGGMDKAKPIIDGKHKFTRTLIRKK